MPDYRDRTPERPRRAPKSAWCSFRISQVSGRRSKSAVVSIRCRARTYRASIDTSGVAIEAQEGPCFALKGDHRTLRSTTAKWAYSKEDTEGFRTAYRGRSGVRFSVVRHAETYLFCFRIGGTLIFIGQLTLLNSVGSYVNNC